MHGLPQSRVLILAIVLAPLVVACGKASSGTGSTIPGASPADAWTWVSGSTAVDVAGSYGTAGAGSTTSGPGARLSPVTWIDASGIFWMFGGNGVDAGGSTGMLNDLWRFDAAAAQWTWVGGSTTVNPSGSYGTRGSPASGTGPGGRNGSSAWTDAAGDEWLFGGTGLDQNGTSGPLDDLWMYAPGTGLWTWVSGPAVVNGIGIYGTRGTGAPANVPGARTLAASWFDLNGNLWLFGGQGSDGTGASDALNDLWEFNPVTGNWAWISGSAVGAASGAYGTKGIAGAANTPGARYGAVSWTDAAGDLWLFGGEGFDSAGTGGALNDLWKFSPSSGEWTWISGSVTVNGTGIYGSRGTAAATSAPGARLRAVAWLDGSGNLWLFGGLGYDSSGKTGYLNDLWEFSPGSGNWTWIGGSNLANPVGSYGTQGTGASGNGPGGRLGAGGWIDSTNSLWLFGGQGEDANGRGGALNDLWKFKP
jgi:N-acetylneuraminic acid mutarotase